MRDLNQEHPNPPMVALRSEKVARFRRDGRGWRKILSPALKKPAITFAVSVLALLALAAPALGMKLKFPGTEDLPRTTPAMQAYDRLAAAYPSNGTTHVVAVEAPASQAASVKAALTKLAAGTQGDPLFAPLETTERELTALADATLEAAIWSLEPSVPFAIIGLGRLGGAELSYASDVDVLFVYDGEHAADFDAAERVATTLLAEIGEITPEGQTFHIDARLRPEGGQGPLARSLGGYARYYDRWGLTWERQALVKARFVAGDPDVAERFAELVERVVYDATRPRRGHRPKAGTAISQ